MAEEKRKKRTEIGLFLGLQSQMARLYQKPLAQYSILATEESITFGLTTSIKTSP